jgi:hypothetical protein
MSTHNQPKKATPALDQALTQVSTADLIGMAESIRRTWRREVAAGRVQLEPGKMRSFDASLTNLKNVTRGG